MNFVRLTPNQSAMILQGYRDLIEQSRQRRSAFQQARRAVDAFLSRRFAGASK